MTEILVERLNDEWQRLSGRSIDRGCADSGVSANLAMEAADEISRLTAALAEAEGRAERADEIAKDLLSSALGGDGIVIKKLHRQIDVANARIAELEGVLKEISAATLALGESKDEQLDVIYDAASSVLKEARDGIDH